MNKKITTEVYYLPHCNNCDGEAYHCDNCGKQFDLNPNSEKYDGEVICVEYLKAKGKNWKNRGHACSDKCADELINRKRRTE